MFVFILGSSGLLIGWGLFLVLTGDYIATLDIAATLISAGVISFSLASLTFAVQRLPAQLTKLYNAHSTQPADSTAPVKNTSSSPPADVSNITKAIAQATNFRPAPQSVQPIPSAPPVIPPAPPPASVDAPLKAFQKSAPSFAPAAAISTPQPAPQMVADPLPEDASFERSFLREGVVDGTLYRFYSDGSAEADSPQGVRYFASIDEVRDSILMARTDSEATSPAAPPPEPREPSAVEPSFAAAFSAYSSTPLVPPSSPTDEGDTQQWVAALGLIPSSSPGMQEEPETVASPAWNNWPTRTEASPGLADLNFSPSRASEIPALFVDSSFAVVRAPELTASSVAQEHRQRVFSPVSYEDTGHIFPVETPREHSAPTVTPPVSQDDNHGTDEWAEPFRMLLKRDRITSENRNGSD
jgi:hypothetical protein